MASLRCCSSLHREFCHKSWRWMSRGSTICVLAPRLKAKNKLIICKNFLCAKFFHILFSRLVAMTLLHLIFDYLTRPPRHNWMHTIIVSIASWMDGLLCPSSEIPLASPSEIARESSRRRRFMLIAIIPSSRKKTFFGRKVHQVVCGMFNSLSTEEKNNLFLIKHCERVDWANSYLFVIISCPHSAIAMIARIALQIQNALAIHSFCFIIRNGAKLPFTIWLFAERAIAKVMFCRVRPIVA